MQPFFGLVFVALMTVTVFAQQPVPPPNSIPIAQLEAPGAQLNVEMQGAVQRFNQLWACMPAGLTKAVPLNKNTIEIFDGPVDSQANNIARRGSSCHYKCGKASKIGFNSSDLNHPNIYLAKAIFAEELYHSLQTQIFPPDKAQVGGAGIPGAGPMPFLEADEWYGEVAARAQSTGLVAGMTGKQPQPGIPDNVAKAVYAKKATATKQKARARLCRALVLIANAPAARTAKQIVALLLYGFCKVYTTDW